MRGYSRYKIFQKGYNLNFLPIRILNLKRPKWDFIKLKIKRLKVLKNRQIRISNFFKAFNTKKLLGVLRQGRCNTLHSKNLVTAFKHYKTAITLKKR